MPLKVEIEEYDKKQEKEEEKAGKYVRIIWNERDRGPYEEKLRTHIFIETNAQAKWNELEQLIKDAEMKVEISIRSGGRKKWEWNEQCYVKR